MRVSALTAPDDPQLTSAGSGTAVRKGAERTLSSRHQASTMADIKGPTVDAEAFRAEGHCCGIRLPVLSSTRAPRQASPWS